MFDSCTGFLHLHRQECLLLLSCAEVLCELSVEEEWLTRLRRNTTALLEMNFSVGFHPGAWSIHVDASLGWINLFCSFFFFEETGGWTVVQVEPSETRPACWRWCLNRLFRRRKSTSLPIVLSPACSATGPGCAMRASRAPPVVAIAGSKNRRRNHVTLQVLDRTRRTLPWIGDYRSTRLWSGVVELDCPLGTSRKEVVVGSTTSTAACWEFPKRDVSGVTSYFQISSFVWRTRPFRRTTVRTLQVPPSGSACILFLRN